MGNGTNNVVVVEYEGYSATVESEVAGRVRVTSCTHPALVGEPNPLAVAASYTFFLILVQHAIASLSGPAYLPDVVVRTGKTG